MKKLASGIKATAKQVAEHKNLLKKGKYTVSSLCDEDDEENARPEEYAKTIAHDGTEMYHKL